MFFIKIIIDFQIVLWHIFKLILLYLKNIFYFNLGFSTLLTNVNPKALIHTRDSYC